MMLLEELMLKLIIAIVTLGAIILAQTHTVTELSLSATSYMAASGSLEGGTLVYVKGSGFSLNINQNLVFLGPYGCSIEPNGVQVTQITCRTTKSTNLNYIQSLQTVVSVGSTSVTCSASSCLFNYLVTKTSYIEDIFPKSVAPDKFLYAFGNIKISNSSLIQRIEVNGTQCSSNQKNAAFSRTYLKAAVNSLQVAGQYDLKAYLSPGFPTISLRAIQTSYFTNKNYTQRVIANITSLSSQKSGSYGNRINITGMGFSSNISDFTCQVAGQTCTVISASPNKVIVEIPPPSSNNTSFGKLPKSPVDGSTQKGAYLGSNGFNYRRYDMAGAIVSLQNWLSYFRGNVTLTLLQQQIWTQFSTPQLTGQSGYVEHSKGYFYAPIDGIYQFITTIDDVFILVMSNVSNNANPANLKTILKSNEYANAAYNFFITNGNTQKNITKNLTKGYYYFESVSNNYFGRGFFKVIVDMPSVRQYSANPAWQIDRITIKPSISTMSGTFQLLINNVPLMINANPNLPYTTSEATLRQLFNQFYNLTQISIWRNTLFAANSKLQYVIQYVGLYSPALPIILDTALIVPSNVSDTILNSVEILRVYPNRQRYSPIPYEFLYTASDTPTLRLTVNSIPAVCTDCSFQYFPAQTPVVTYLQRFNAIYQISVSDPGLLNFQLSDLNITMLGVACVNMTGSISNFTCSLPINADGSAALPAGTGVPQVFVTQIGYTNTTALISETVPLIVNSFDPPQSSISGGIEATISGSGFPISSASAGSLNISICGKIVPMTNVTYISNQQIKVIIPAETVPCSDSNNIVYYSDQQSYFTFSYNPCLAPKDFVRCSNSLSFDLTDNTRENFVRMWSNAIQWPNRVLPSFNSSLIIPYEWNLLLDIDTPVLNYLQINGNLVFDNTKNLTLQSRYIWINKGTLKIGSETMSYSLQANIILHGDNNDFRMVIDRSASGNKMLAVTGGLELCGQQPATSWTRLTRTALVGDNQITVSQSYGWKVGNQIVIAPSYSNNNESEKVTITSISGNLISFTPSLLYQHYGASTATIENSYGIIDIRSAVGLLTRNIKISSAASATNWGGRVLIYGYQQESTSQWVNGYAKLRGVQIEGCGQFNTTGAALRIENVNINSASSPTPTVVENSVIHNCQGRCVFVSNNKDVSMVNNVLHQSRGNMVFVDKSVSQFTFTNNLLDGTTKLMTNDQDENVFGFLHLPTSDFSLLDSINVSNNLLQGSEGAGFVLPVTECSRIGSYSYSNNTAGTCEVAFVYESAATVSSSCLAAKGAIAYASKVGLMANLASSNLSQVEYSQMMFADNLRAVSLRFCHQSDDNTLIFKDSFISGVSRPSCPSCYSSSKISYCQGAEAVRMLAVTANRTGDIFQTPIMSLDQVNTQQSFDAKAFLNNVRFENFFYSNSSPSQPPFCTNMAVFKRNTDGSDSTASHYLTNTTCANCQPDAWAYFDPPSVADRPQCGGIDCTGPNNYLIDDQDGKFTGRVSQILANNSVIGDHESSCQSMPAINGHWCNSSTSFAVLEYESEYDTDNETNSMPVHLSHDGGVQISVTNAAKQQFQQQRLSRFWSIVGFKRTYTLNYSSAPPLESRYQIQKRHLPLGNDSDWIVLRLKYPEPISADIFVSNDSLSDVLIKPIPLVNNATFDFSTSQSSCGANIFHFESNQLKFVVNGKSNCRVSVRFVNNLKVRLLLKLNSTLLAFFSENRLQSITRGLMSFLEMEESHFTTINVRDSLGLIQIEMLISSQKTQQSIWSDKSTLAELVEIKQRLDSSFSQSTFYTNNHLITFVSQITMGNQVYHLPLHISEGILESDERQQMYFEQFYLPSLVSLVCTFAFLVIKICHLGNQGNKNPQALPEKRLLTIKAESFKSKGIQSQSRNSFMAQLNLLAN